MGENLLSLVHIQKLGHPIEEIRQRALGSVISKYNLHLVDETNLVNTKLLLENLLDWFDFEKYSEEGKVLNLLLKIVEYKNADLILKEIDKRTLVKRVKDIGKKVGCEYQAVIQDIIKSITNAGADTEDFYRFTDFPPADTSEYNSGCEYQDFYSSSRESKYREEDITQTDCTESTKVSEVKQKLNFKVDYFPWQHLTSTDKEILSSVYDKLRYIDDKSTLLQSCQVYADGLLKDFPAEVFIQRPLIVKTLLHLMECADQEVRVPVIKCLTKTVQSLRKKIGEALNALLFNLKKEFYTTVTPYDNPDNPDSSIVSYSGILHLDDSDFIDPNMKQYQISASEFCFEVLLKVSPHLGMKYNQEETNCFLNLFHETLCCLLFNLNTEIWDEKDLRNQFYRVFGKLYEALRFQKGKNQIFYVILLYFTIKILNSIKPPSGVELSEILVTGLQSELGSCISDSALVLLFPRLHSEVVKYVQQLLGQKEKEVIQDNKEVLIILDSMHSSIRFLRYHDQLKSRMEKLECFHSALAGLDFHQNFSLVRQFVNSCLLKWRNAQLTDEETKLREKILIKLLANCNDFIKICAYKEIHDHAEKLLGVDEARTPRFEFPGDKMDFLFQTDVLTEIICHGLSCPIPQVRHYSSDIMNHLLKGKFIMSERSWSDFLTALYPCLGLLQCYADKATKLGRCIIKMFDPDVSKSAGLPPLQVLKGNLRFLFSKNSLIREEAISRLFWLLSKEDRENKKLPKMNLLTELHLSGICCCVKPKDFNRIQRSFYSPGRLCDVMEMLGAEHVEPNLRRSALSQIAVMMDDVHLHSTFLEQDGLEKLLRILENCLIEKEYRNYPDSIIPITDILKALAFQNVSVRQELSSRIDVMYNILRGLLLFSSDSTLRQNAVELICLLLYSECTLRLPSELSPECAMSFPDLLVSRMCLPFSTHSHWKISRHLEPSLKKSVMSNPNCSKLIRASWAMQWVGGLSDLLAINPSDIPEKAFSPGIPDDMKISAEDLTTLRNCAFGVSVKQSLYDIQNATTHHAVLNSLQKLHSYLLLYNVDRSTNGKKSSDVGSDTVLSHMLWESTLERFMTAQPSCGEDEALLLQVIQLVQLLLKSFTSQRLIDWVGKLLTDEHQPFMNLLKNVGNKTLGLVGKELRTAIAQLTEDIVVLKSSLDRNKWFAYLELISENLKLDQKKNFRNFNCVDWLLSLLMHLTGKWSWDFTDKDELLEKLIIRLMGIIIKYRCAKDSPVSFTGNAVIRNALLVLNHLTANAQMWVKDWETLWYQALRKAMGRDRDANYYWLMSLWFTRDPITRAATHALLVSFTTTARSCHLLIDRLQIDFDHIWSQTFRTLFDESECSFVREKAVLLLTNLTNQGTKATCGEFLQHLQKIKFYQELPKVISNYDCESTLRAVQLHESLNRFSGHVVTTPSFAASICVFLTSLMALNPSEVSGNLLKCDILEGLTTLLGEIPESAGTWGEHKQSADILEMYTVVCRLLTKCVMASCTVHSFLLQSPHCINNLFAMINYNLFCEASKVIERRKFELWLEILDLFTALLTNNPKCQKNPQKDTNGFILLNKCITNNGIDNFTSSLYIAMTSDDSNLRFAVFRFFINVLRHELTVPKHEATMSDLFDRKVSENALKTAESRGWQALKPHDTFIPNFGVRTADILSRLFLLGSGCTGNGSKTIVPDCLGSLSAVCKPAQNFCIEIGLPNVLVGNLKQIIVKLNLEKVENLKKPSSRKKIEPLLSEAETKFRLICNLMLGNVKGKSAFTDCALSSVVHNLWPWCMAKTHLLTVVLKMLCTFTHSCDQACRTLVGSLNLWGVKKPPGSATLVNSIMNHVSTEMDLISNSTDSQTLPLCLQLLTNCCRVLECRSVISKGNFLPCFTRMHPDHPDRKKRVYSESTVDSWLKFLIAFSSYPDGQLALTKIQDLLELLTIKSSSGKSRHRLDALTVLRNISFHQTNRPRLLGSCSFLSLLFETLDSARGEEVQTAAIAIWSLTCNCQKAKLILRSSGFEAKLLATQQRCVLSQDTETAGIVETVLGILRNK